jgi:hypothetical protein
MQARYVDGEKKALRQPWRRNHGGVHPKGKAWGNSGKDRGMSCIHIRIIVMSRGGIFQLGAFVRDFARELSFRIGWRMEHKNPIGKPKKHDARPSSHHITE